MYSFLNKYGQALAFGLGVLITIVFLIMIFTNPETARVDQMTADEKFETSMFDFGIAISLFLTVAAAAGMFLFGIFQMISNFKTSLKGIIGFAVILALMFIAYTMSPGEADHPTIEAAINKFKDAQEAELTAGNLKFIGGSIVTALVMLAVSFVVLIVFGVRNFFK